MQALAKGDRDGFYEQERIYRERVAAPPFGRLTAIVVSGYDGEQVREIARVLGKAAPTAKDIKVWGPTPAFYALLRGQTRERLLVQAAKGVDVQAYTRAWLARLKIPAAVRVVVDVDPISFLLKVHHFRLPTIVVDIRKYGSVQHARIFVRICTKCLNVIQNKFVVSSISENSPTNGKRKSQLVSQPLHESQIQRDFIFG